MNNFEKILDKNKNYISGLSQKAKKSTVIDNELYSKYDVKRGLRDINGNGVLAGLTEISNIQSFKVDDKGNKVPCEGELRYRGVNIVDLVSGFMSEKRFGFEECSYLLLFGELPSKKELAEFNNLLAEFRTLPNSFVRDTIMKAPSQDMMNSLARSVLTLYSYDENPDDISIENVLIQCLHLIARLPMLSVYSYQSYKHYHEGESMHIHHSNPNLSSAENMLHLLRPDSKFTELEARVLDLVMVLHAEHGGGNNSSFTTHVVSSSGSDTYSVMAGALGSLKGPRHGGANIKVVQMVEDMKNNLKNYKDDTIKDYLNKLLSKKAFDGSGLIYGMGHAVYSLSDPRATIMKAYTQKLSVAKDRQQEFELYSKIEKLAPEIIGEKRSIYKGVSANVDFYSGFINSMLDIPTELYTPIFAMARIVGWSAHRIEELSNNGKIIRPGYRCVSDNVDYSPISKRK